MSDIVVDLGNDLILNLAESVLTLDLTCAAGPRGAKGDTGEVGASQFVTVAAVALGGQRAVVLDADGYAHYADCTVVTHAERVVGLTVGRYYLDTTAGGITATPPSATNNVSQYVGKAISATELNFEPDDGVIV